MERLAAEVLARRKEAAEMQARLQEGERLLRELREAHERHREELERHRMRENEFRLRIETLFEEIRREHGIEVQPEELAKAEAQDAEALEKEITELRDRLEKLGNVNHAALEELAEVEQKLEFMKREEADLVAADEQLRTAIVEIDQTCVQRFTETFERISENFKEVFRKLFGGGKAEISLENPDDVLNTGVEIRVRPPGKELRNLALLSGGEKSLTTVALLFAIYQTKPPPFCLLDEVDAALDEANTVRMCEMLKEYATRGQFLVITHSRPTMTAADALYGVTMPEAGVSRRVQVRFADIEAGRVVGLN
jgi:chromosome segregation protein